MRKTFWHSLLVVVLVIAMALPLFSCTGGDVTDDTSADTTNQTTASQTDTDANDETLADTLPEGSTSDGETTAETEQTPEPVVPVEMFTYEYLYQASRYGDADGYWKDNTAVQNEGYVTLTSTGTDPWVAAFVDSKTIDGKKVEQTKILAIKYRTDYSVTAQLMLNVRNFKNHDFYWVGDGEWHLAVLDISDVAPNKANPTALRLDYTSFKDVSVDIQYIAFFESAEDAQAYDATVENPVVSKDISQLPDFKVSGVFASHMVVQRDMPIEVWGFSNTAGSTVSGVFDNQTVTAQVADDGTWKLTFDAHTYNKVGQSMTISDDRGHETVFEDILIGDVWLVGGQSNAELTVAPCVNYTPQMDIDENDAIRLFTQTQAYVYGNQAYCLQPQNDVINPAWTWKRSDTQAVYAFSAMGYFFAKEVFEQTDIPQGMIMMAAGGACLSELLPAELAHEQGYMQGANVREGGYYNALIHPFVGLNCKGMLFFQGESEGGQRAWAEKYKEEMTLLIADERERWGQDFPLYFVQLSNYRSEGTQYFPYHDTVRIQQFEALQSIPNSTMVVAMDLGAPADYGDWAHSPYKYKLGLRLAQVVMAKEYDKGQVSQVSSPMPVKATLSEDKTKITIEFENVADGLVVLGMTPEASIGKNVAGFSVGDYNHRTLTTATITSSNTVVVDVPEGVNPTQVNYAYFLIVTPENANLYASNELPAAAFSLPL